MFDSCLLYLDSALDSLRISFIAQPFVFNLELEDDRAARQVVKDRSEHVGQSEIFVIGKYFYRLVVHIVFSAQNVLDHALLPHFYDPVPRRFSFNRLDVTSATSLPIAEIQIQQVSGGRYCLRLVLVILILRVEFKRQFWLSVLYQYYQCSSQFTLVFQTPVDAVYLLAIAQNLNKKVQLLNVYVFLDVGQNNFGFVNGIQRGELVFNGTIVLVYFDQTLANNVSSGHYLINDAIIGKLNQSFDFFGAAIGQLRNSDGVGNLDLTYSYQAAGQLRHFFLPFESLVKVKGTVKLEHNAAPVAAKFFNFKGLVQFGIKYETNVKKFDINRKKILFESNLESLYLISKDVTSSKLELVMMR
ncbi:hypothetical protein BpHYR1_010780 [Brachionus plicatilis]|uniref:Uncharacterized protein n=1 Tax=Brachionus plicatilis TaxID=10195 RepID=A0A3M7QVC0_BRAPC|nr:hypothetical protein BpHYR1_010780 [Brachionus plicatilis]